MSRINFNELPEELLPLMMQTENHIERLGFDNKLIELMRLVASNKNQCIYCIELHKNIALEAGESIERIQAVNNWRESTFFTAVERACLAWAEYVTEPMNSDDVDELFVDMMEYFDKKSIANLTLVMTQINTWNRLMKSFGIES